MAPLRILLIMNGLGWAGAETQLKHLAVGLGERGHQVRILAIGGVHVGVGRLEEAGVEVVALEAVGPRAKARALPKMVRHARWAEVVHCTGYDATLWGRLAAVIARRPVVITEHTPGRELQTKPDGTPRGQTIALHNRLLDRFTFATIAVGRWQFDLLEGEGVRRGAMVHIPNGVPVAALRRQAEEGPSRADLGLPDAAKVVAHVARFSTQKGQGRSLQAVAELREGLGDVRLLFVGDGGEEARVREEAAAMGADWATFLGRRDDVPGILDLADLAVLPSSGEGLPMALVEAIAVRTSIVATDVGDVRWLLERTGAGICVAADDAEGFEAACRTVLEDADLRARFKRAAEAAADEFDAAEMTRRYEEVLEAAARSRRR